MTQLSYLQDGRPLNMSTLNMLDHGLNLSLKSNQDNPCYNTD